MTFPIPTNPPFVIGSSLHTVGAIGSSLETVFGMGNPPSGATGPANVTANLKLWIDATTITGVSSGNSISNWTDRLGTAFTNSLATEQPKYQTGVQNSLAMVRGVNAANFGLSNPASFITQAPFTILGVSRASTAASMSFFGNNRLDAGSTSTTKPRLALGGTVVLSGPPSYWTTGQVIQHTLFWNSDFTVNFYTGGTLFSTVTGIGEGVNAPSPMTIMGTGAQSWIGDVGEIIVYSRILSASERTAIESYLTTKWGL